MILKGDNEVAIVKKGKLRIRPWDDWLKTQKRRKSRRQMRELKARKLSEFKA